MLTPSMYSWWLQAAFLFWRGMSSYETLFTRTSSVLDLAHRLLFSNPCFLTCKMENIKYVPHRIVEIHIKLCIHSSFKSSWHVVNLQKNDTCCFCHYWYLTILMGILHYFMPWLWNYFSNWIFYFKFVVWFMRCYI